MDLNCLGTSTVGGPCSLGGLHLFEDLFCSGDLFVWGHCIVCLGTSFIWGPHLSNILGVSGSPFPRICVGSFADLAHPGTLFVPSLCLPGALIFPHPWLFWDLFVLFATFFDGGPHWFGNFFWLGTPLVSKCFFYRGTRWFGNLFWWGTPLVWKPCSLGTLLLSKGTPSFRDVHEGDLVWLGTLFVWGSLETYWLIGAELQCSSLWMSQTNSDWTRYSAPSTPHF